MHEKFTREKLKSIKKIVDIKTTSDIELWDKKKQYVTGSPYKLHYDVQAFIYSTIFNIDYKKIDIVCIDVDEPDLEIALDKGFTPLNSS